MRGGLRIAGCIQSGTFWVSSFVGRRADVHGARRPASPAAGRESEDERGSLSPPWTATRPAMRLPVESSRSRSDSNTGHAEVIVVFVGFIVDRRFFQQRLILRSEEHTS